jgi:hypothetical protein
MVFSRRQWILTGLITVGCLGTYFGMRALPVEACEVLHYGDYITAEGVIEGCGYEETGFFDLKALRYPVIARLEPLSSLRVGQPASFLLHLRTSTGRSISYEEVAVSHTERLHAMVVDESLGDYQHLHPKNGGAPGTWTVSFTPRHGGTYRMFLDFIPLKTARRTLAMTSFEVEGAAEAMERADGRTQLTADGLAVRLVPAEETLRAGEDIAFRLEVSGRDGLVFDPVMDSFAHLVAFAPGRDGFAHFHPRNPFIAGQDPRNPELDFVFTVEDAGAYRVWAQFSVDGSEHFVPFDLEVEAASRGRARG